jgi:hypothetical protein
VHPSGTVRLIAGLEALNGLVLIGWSASFTYLTMEKVWDTKRESAGRYPLRASQSSVSIIDERRVHGFAGEAFGHALEPLQSPRRAL